MAEAGDIQELERRLALAESRIAELQAAEQALRESEERFRSVSDSDVIAIAFFNTSGAITDANEAFLHLVGYTRGELQAGAVRWDRLTPPEWMPQTQEAVRQYQRTGRIKPYEKEYFRKSGERFWGLFGGRRIESSGEGVAFVMDITDRKRAEAVLRESEERQAFLLQLSDALRPLTTPAAIQGAAARMLGQHLKISSVTYSEFEPDEDTFTIHGDYGDGRMPSLVGVRSRLSAHGPGYGPTLLAGKTIAYSDIREDPSAEPGGSAESASMSQVSGAAVPLIKDGRLVAMFSFAHPEPRSWAESELQLLRDVAERTWATVERARAEAALRESEQNLHGVANVVPDLLWHSASDGSTPWYNNRWFEYTGQTLEQAGGWGWADSIHPDDREGSARRYREAVEQSKPLQQEHRIRNAAGEYRWFLVRAEPLRDANGRVTRMYGAATDIHEQRLAMGALRESEERQAFLDQVGKELARLAEPEQIIQIVGGMLGRFLSVDSIIVVDVHNKTDRITIHHAWTSRGTLNLVGDHSIDDYVTPEYAKSHRAGLSFFVCDTETDPETDAEAYWRIGIRSWVSVPFLSGGHWVGYTAATCARPRHWRADEIELMREISDRLFARIARVRAEASLRESEERQAFLLRLSDVLRPLADPAEMRAMGTKFLAEHMGVMRASYFEIDDDQEHFVQGTGYEDGSSRLPARMRLSDFDRDIADAYRAGQTFVVRDTETDARLEEKREAYRAINLRAWIATPLEREGRLLSVLGVNSDVPRAWTDSEIRLVEEVGERIWAATDRVSAAAALRESEEQFRLYVENVLEYALVQTDVKGNVTSWNPGAERLFGYSSAEIVSQPFAILMPEKDRREDVIAREMAALSRGEKNIEAHTVQRKDGSQFWAEWVTEPVFDDGGKLRGTAKVVRDETERQAAETAIRTSLAEKEELLKEVHHRVKNNLQVIVSLLNMQSSQIRDELTLERFQEARNRVLAISSIHELLYRSESFAGIKLTDYARQLAPGLIHFYGLGSRVQVEISGDGNKLELERAVPFGMLLNELISNACKHAFPAPHSGKIAIRVEPAEGTLTVTVADDGKGLPEGFDYEKAASLGLKLVHALARQLRGTVDVSTNPGTTFKIRFPSAPTGEEDE